MYLGGFYLPALYRVAFPGGLAVVPPPGIVPASRWRPGEDADGEAAGVQPPVLGGAACERSGRIARRWSFRVPAMNLAGSVQVSALMYLSGSGQAAPGG